MDLLRLEVGIGKDYATDDMNCRPPLMCSVEIKGFKVGIPADVLRAIMYICFPIQHVMYVCSVDRRRRGGEVPSR